MPHQKRQWPELFQEAHVSLGEEASAPVGRIAAILADLSGGVRASYAPRSERIRGAGQES